MIAGSYAFFHANRLKMYEEFSLEVSITILDSINHNEIRLNNVENLL